ncbi:MAG: hypothetical protein GY698_05390 [Actinomycetia bacterium]|nr:hypothetical protein [Actinomycetes bacterium]
MIAMNKGGPRRGLTPARTFIYAVVALISVAAVVSINRLDTTGKAAGIVLDVEAARQTTRSPFVDQWEYTYEVRISPALGGYTRDLHTTDEFDIGDQIEVLVVAREGGLAFEPVGTVRNLWWLTIAVGGLAVASLLGSGAVLRSRGGGQNLVMGAGLVAGAIAVLVALWMGVPRLAEATASTAPADVGRVHMLGASGGVDIEVITGSGRAVETNVAARWWLSHGEPGVIEVVETDRGLLVRGDDRFGPRGLAIVGLWAFSLVAGGVIWSAKRDRRRSAPTPPTELSAH